MSDEPKSFLDHITTRWSQIVDPERFVLRYSGAIRRYLKALIPDPDVRDDVAQDFLMRVIKQGFAETQVTRGRFRDYLKVAVRNAALTQLRKRPSTPATDLMLQSLAVEDDPATNRAWDEGWRNTILDQAWEKLNDHERRSPGNLFYTVLRMMVEAPDADSVALAAKISQKIGRTVQAPAIRQQRVSARRKFAELIIDEIRSTITDPSPDSLQEELADLELLELVKPYLND